MRLSPFIFAVVAVLWASGARAAGDDPLQRGNRLYAEGKYAAAAAAYETAVDGDRVQANLFYNLGDASFRAGNRGRAILNYQRALLLEPSHAEAAANLAFVGGGRPSGVSTGGIDTLCWLTAGAGWLAALGVLLTVFQRRRRAFAAALIAVGLLGGVSGVGTLWWVGGGARDGSRALVVAEGAAAHYSPADNSRVMTTLPAGAEVRVLSGQGAWIYAALADGTRAWVASDKVERLIPGR